MPRLGMVNVVNQEVSRGAFQGGSPNPAEISGWNSVLPKPSLVPSSSGLCLRNSRNLVVSSEHLFSYPFVAHRPLNTLMYSSSQCFPEGWCCQTPQSWETQPHPCSPSLFSCQSLNSHPPLSDLEVLPNWTIFSRGSISYNVIPYYNIDLFCFPYSINLEMPSPWRAMFGAPSLQQELFLDGISLSHQHRTQLYFRHLVSAAYVTYKATMTSVNGILPPLDIRHFQQTTEPTAKANLRGSSAAIFWIFQRQKRKFLFKRLAQSLL